MSQIDDALARIRAWRAPDESTTSSPFKETCTAGPAATESEVHVAWRDHGLPRELKELWLASQSVRLFEDAEYGQWGLVLLPPAASATRTVQEKAARPSEYRGDDIVIGEFLGDQDLLVMTPVGDGKHAVLVALPLDPRSGWYRVGESLSGFLLEYLSRGGEKYWEVHR